MSTSGGSSSLQEDEAEAEASERPPLNRRAVWALVTGVLLPVPVGAYLGFTALQQIRIEGQRGRWLAIVSIVVSFVTLLVWSFGVHPDFVDDPKPVDWQQLKVGDCFNRDSAARPDDTYFVLPCDHPHKWEVVGWTTVDRDSAVAVRTQVGQRCQRLSTVYSMDSWAIPESVQLHSVYPTVLGETLGLDRAVCLLSSPHEELTASLRRDRHSLEAPQFGYLDAVNTRWEYDEDHAPPHGAVSAGSLAAYRKWARGQARADRAETDSLDSVRWPGRARRPAAAFLRDVRLSRAAWLRAAAADDVAEFKRLRLVAESGTARREANALRGALRLATDPGQHQAA